MELAIVAVLVVIVLWWIGVFNSAGKIIDMGNAEIDQLSKDQFVTHIQRSKKRKVTTEDVTEAIDNDALITKYMESVR